MKIQFDSVSAALSMDGHGGYVWFIYVVATLVVAWLLIAPVLRSRSALSRARGQMRREKQMQQGSVDAPGS